MPRPLSPPLPRRAILKSGLAGFAALMSRPLAGCGTRTDASSPPGEDGGAEAAAADAAVSRGDEFPYTPIERPKLVSLIAAIGPLGEPDESGVRLPAGFTARIVAEAGKTPIAGGSYTWHGAPDGGATFPTQDGGWIYVSNAELPFVGGVGALRFDPQGTLIDAYPILEETSANCAGGPTPWDTWLSCEEISSGRVFECDPRGERPAVVRPALGTFQHEAAAVDPIKHHVYLTEDVKDGCLYRFVPAGLAPHGFGNLGAGELQVAKVDADNRVTWHTLPDPTWEGPTPTRDQIPSATRFKGGEGIWWHDGIVYFTTKGDNRVWAYDTNTETLRILYDRATSDTPILSGVDNLTVSCCGDVLVAEDGGDMEIVAILPSGELKPIVQVVGQSRSEIAGPAFDPSGTRLYFSSQRGGRGGITYEVTGPFHAPA
jgi:uncharacterized protein